ncbi:uncharacterized protein LOC110839461 [Zootermopsis nevadensis]|uniref:uncharacterized protein LOC110839461 n=1 Tax=Zootermopsis nevadensis TaxID=136037 RepID=UPI000B8E3EE9|nr:uncharacterized protein LOC110839461 [Zootermopsis nevadensis]
MAYFSELRVFCVKGFCQNGSVVRVQRECKVIFHRREGLKGNSCLSFRNDFCFNGFASAYLKPRFGRSLRETLDINVLAVTQFQLKNSEMDRLLTQHFIVSVARDSDVMKVMSLICICGLRVMLEVSQKGRCAVIWEHPANYGCAPRYLAFGGANLSAKNVATRHLRPLPKTRTGTWLETRFSKWPRLGLKPTRSSSDTERG